MPVLKHAKKKLRHDKKRTLDNLKIRDTFKKLLKAAKAHPTAEAINAAFSSIDKAAKKNIIHKNKAARLKASISKAANGGKKQTDGEKAAVKPAKKTAKAKSATKKAAK